MNINRNIKGFSIIFQDISSRASRNINRNIKGFSIIELLTAIIIISFLSVLGIKFFDGEKKKALRIAAQSEAFLLMALIKTARENDGYYHQFIYQMGYKPQGALTANIGVKASNTTPCCSNYPNLGATKCHKSILTGSSITINSGAKCPYGTKNNTGTFVGGFCNTNPCTCVSLDSYENYIYYNCKNDALNKAVDARTICDNSSYTEYECVWKKSAPAVITSSTSFGSCSATCNCNEIDVGVLSKSFDEKMVLNSSGAFCID